MVVKKSKSKPISTYPAKVGCWNCDDVYDIKVVSGINVTQYLMDSELECRRCECISLRNIKEYKVNNKIMKDIILHRAIENYENRPHAPAEKHDHIQ